MKLTRSDIADLVYFQVVAKNNNFRLAGIELGISASAVSHKIKALEARLGVRLLNRTNRSVTMTAAGLQLSNALMDPLEAIDRAADILNDYRDAPAGRVRLNVSSGASSALISSVLPEFVERYPAVTVEIAVTNRMVDVVKEGYDAGIRYGGTVPVDMIAQRLTPQVRWMVVGAPEYLRRFGVPETPKSLSDHRCVQIRVGDGTVYRWEFANGSDRISVSVPGPIIVDDGEIALRLALGGMGLVYMNEWDVAEFVAEQKLVPVLQEWSPEGPGLFAYYSGRNQVPTALRLLIDLIKELKPFG